MPNTDKALLLQYAELKTLEKQTSQRIKELAPNVLEAVQRYQFEAAEQSPVSIEGVGTYSLKFLKTWTFPQEVEELRAKLKEAEVDAQRTGRATFEEKPSLTFTGVTNERTNE